MSNNAQRKTLMMDYLLGQMSPEQRTEFEEQYLSNDDLFEELEAAENDMIDAYIRGELGATEQKQFETYYLSSPERRERVQFAKSLMNYGSAPRELTPGAGKLRSDATTAFGGVPSPGMRLALAAVLVVAIAGFSWMAAANRKLRHQLETAQAEQADAQRQAQQLRQTVADLQAGQNPATLTDMPAPGSIVLSLALAPDLVRNGNQQQSTLHLTAGISEVRLLLRHDHDGNLTYNAVLETAEGTQVWRRNSLASRPASNGSTVITVQISPSVLKRDDYILRLFRLTSNGKAEDVGAYSFRVLK